VNYSTSTSIIIGSDRRSECKLGKSSLLLWMPNIWRYESSQHILGSELQPSWEESCNDGNIVISLQSVLAPYNDNRLSYAACESILAATFNYIRRSGHQLWFFQCQCATTTTFFIFSEVIFVWVVQFWQYCEYDTSVHILTGATHQIVERLKPGNVHMWFSSRSGYRPFITPPPTLSN